jgi:hypothetical protein
LDVSKNSEDVQSARTRHTENINKSNVQKNAGIGISKNNYIINKTMDIGHPKYVKNSEL